MNISEMLCKLLEAKGVKCVFYVPGGAIIHLVKAFNNSPIKLIPAYSEQGAVVAAEAYSKYTRNLGVAMVTSGPGVTNAATGIVSSYIDRSNVLILAGFIQKWQIKTDETRSYGPQEFCTKDLYDKVTVNNYLVQSQTEINKVFEVFRSFDDKCKLGPSIIQIYLDIQAAPIKASDYEFLSTSLNNKISYGWSLECQKRLKEEVCARFQGKYKVSILVGGGCNQSNESINTLRQLCDTGAIPMCVSWQAKDLIDHRSDGFVGLPGYFANRSANYCLDESDCIISIGCRMDLLQLGFTNKVIDAHIIQIDIDPNELFKQEFKSSTSYLIDAHIALQIINSCVKNTDLYFNTEWTSKMKKLYVDTLREKVNEQYPCGLNPYKVVDTLSNYACEIYIAGSSGGCAEISFLNYYLKKPTRFINMPGLGSMGFGVACMGMAVNAFPTKTIFALIGDGGLHMNLQELAMLSQADASKAYLFILNNSGYDSIRRSQNNYMKEYIHCDSQSGMHLPDWSLIAKAYSLNYFKVTSEEDLNNFLDSSQSGIWLIDIYTASNVPSAPKIIPAMNKSGQITSGGLKDLG